MEIANLLFISVLIITVPEIRSGNGNSDENITKPSPGYNPLEDLILNQDENAFTPGASLTRLIRQINSEKRKDEDTTNKPLPAYNNPLEDLILHQDKKRFSDASLSRVKRQYREYPYPYPIPIIVGGGFGGFGRRGFGGRGFGGRGFSGRGIGGRGFGGSGFGGRGFGGRGFGGRGFGGRGIGGGIGGRGVGGGRGGGRG